MKILDQIGRELLFDPTSKPGRVVSLVPSITELVFDIGFEVVGRTKFCIHPSEIKTTAVIGGTKNVKVEKIQSLKPDLVIANKEENTKEAIEAIIELGIPVFVSDVGTLEDNLDLIKKLGEIGDFEQKAEDLIQKTSQGMDSIVSPNNAVRVLYLIWKGPYMAAGTDTFISDILQRLGAKNAFFDQSEAHLRYPEVSLSDISSLKPDFLLLSSEPYPFKQEHAEELEQATGIKTMLVDGECFSWYGSRLVKSMDYLLRFSRLLQDEVNK